MLTGGERGDLPQAEATGAHMKGIVVEDLEVKRRWKGRASRPEELHLLVVSFVVVRGRHVAFATIHIDTAQRRQHDGAASEAAASATSTTNVDGGEDNDNDGTPEKATLSTMKGTDPKPENKTSLDGKPPRD